MAAPASGLHMSLPKLELPAFKGEKGAKAQIWLKSYRRFQKFHRMTDEQAVELARFSCKGNYAKAWAGCFRRILLWPRLKNILRPSLLWKIRTN
jgi:hypothetical protein